MIDFTRAFDTAWKRTTVILFAPFDLGKWCIIGFSAFLAGLLEGGNGINGGSFNNYRNLSPQSDSGDLPIPKFDVHQFNHVSSLFAGMQVGLIVLLSLVILAVVFAVALLIYWLGARGQFLFLDNIVRNRGAIVEPWTRYARPANGLFGFYLLFMVVSFVLIVPIVVVAVVMMIPLFQHHRWPEGAETGVFVALGALYLVLAVVFGFLIFVFRELGVPLMFRNGLTAYAALLEALGLVKRHFLSIFVLVLIRIALFFAVLVVSVIACCFSCCLVLIPYVGTVILLPALIYVRCFTLDCLAQFGPEYDVFTVDVAPVVPGVILPPPRG